METPAFFGEILPVVSRAVDDDGDEEIENKTEPVTLSWAPHISNEKYLQCGGLIVAIGPEACGFTELYLISDYETEVIGTLDSGKNSSASMNEPQYSISCGTIKRLKLKPEIVFIQLTADLDQCLTHSWTTQLASYFNLPGCNISILGSMLASQYNIDSHNDDLEVPFLRSLQTSLCGTTASPPIEQPNVVTGLAAEILTALELKSLPGVLYIAFKETQQLDIETIKCFKKILSTDPFKGFITKRPTIDQKLVQFMEVHEDRNTIYI